MPVSKNDARIDEDPFLLLGYGMNSYFAVVVQLLIMVGLITCVTIPLMLIYSSYDDLAGVLGYDFNQYTLGNMGGAVAFCAQSTFKTEQMGIPIKCTTGVISISAVGENTGKPIYDFGVIPKSSESSNYCTNESFKDPARCSDYLDTNAIETALKADCVGKASCTLTGLSTFIQSSRAGFDAVECGGADSQMFI